ncbi:MAG: MCE family protein [Bacteroidetes bacterium]|nr:MCE family protein [Bacteroidota bacterium]
MKNIINKFTVISSILLFTIAFQFFSCKKPCENKIIAVFESAGRLEEGNKVQSKGIEIGEVTRIDLSGKGKVIVELCINPKYKIPKNSTCSVSMVSLFGDKIVEVIYSEDPTFCANNDTIQGSNLSTLGNVFKSIIDEVKDSLTFTDSLGNKVNIIDSIQKNAK